MSNIPQEPKRQEYKITPGDLAHKIRKDQKIDKRKKDDEDARVFIKCPDCKSGTYVPGPCATCKGEKKIPVWEKPNVCDVAEVFLKEYDILRDKGEFIYVFDRERFFWKEWTEKTLVAHAIRFDLPEHTTTRRRKEITDYALSSMTEYREMKWNNIDPSEIAFSDNVVNVVTGKKRRHKQDDYLTSVIPFKCDPNAKCETWLKCLDQWFESEDKKEALQEYFGYLLTNHNNFKKALLLIGESNTGKSVITDMAVEICGGLENVSAVPIEHMDDPKTVAPIKNKRLNLISEISVGTIMADGGFKRLVSSEPTLMNNKYDRLETVTPFAKHILATNNKPKIRDKSLGVFNRLLILKMNRVVAIEEQNPNLREDLRKEIVGILAWAIEGAKRLLARGRFDDPCESLHLLNEYRREQDPMESFISLGVVKRDTSAAIPFRRLFDLFLNHHGGNWTPNGFSRLLHESKFETKHIKSGATTIRVVLGLVETGQVIGDSGFTRVIDDDCDHELF